MDFKILECLKERLQRGAPNFGKTPYGKGAASRPRSHTNQLQNKIKQLKNLFRHPHRTAVRARRRTYLRFIGFRVRFFLPHQIRMAVFGYP